MTKHQFTSAERYAIFTVHGGVCYMCDAPVTMKTFEVDHVVPEHLGDHPAELARVRAEVGLPEDFRVNSYENWVPSCRDCNLKKLGMVWKPSLQVQRILQRAQLRAPSLDCSRDPLIDRLQEREKALLTWENVCSRRTRSRKKRGLLEGTS